MIKLLFIAKIISYGNNINYSQLDLVDKNYNGYATIYNYCGTYWFSPEKVFNNLNDFDTSKTYNFYRITLFRKHDMKNYIYSNATDIVFDYPFSNCLITKYFYCKIKATNYTFDHEKTRKKAMKSQNFIKDKPIKIVYYYTSFGLDKVK